MMHAPVLSEIHLENRLKSATKHVSWNVENSNKSPSAMKRSLARTAPPVSGLIGTTCAKKDFSTRKNDDQSALDWDALYADNKSNLKFLFGNEDSKKSYTSLSEFLLSVFRQTRKFTRYFSMIKLQFANIDLQRLGSNLTEIVF